mmetsp:Transcript_25394/g.73230  ORF Transcript_25394/g.73230 Transcript_25394/m.73230 type:complete len:598 (-) Transcript_25394:99-1892(-)
MVRPGGIPEFRAEGTCPSGPQELQQCILRFICGSPSFGPFPVSVVGLNADLRRAYQRAGHERTALSIFRASNTGEAIKAIQASLQSMGCSGALSLEEAEGDDVLILDADRGRLHARLVAPGAADGTVEPKLKAPLRASETRTCPEQVPSTAVKRDRPSTRAEPACAREDDDDELARLLAEPTVRRKDWEGPGAGGAPGAGSRARSGSALSAGRERRRDGRDRRRRRDRTQEAAAAPASQPGAPEACGGPVPLGPRPGSLPCEAAGASLPPPGSTFVFDPDGDGPGEILLPEPRRTVSSVPLFEWVSADSIADLRARGRAEARAEPRDRSRTRGRSRARRGRRSRSRAADERPERASADAWERSREGTGLKLIRELSDRPWAYPLVDESRRSFAGYLRRPFSPEECQAFFARIRDGAEWTQPDVPGGALPRKTCWMVSAGCTCTYRYGGIEVTPQGFPPWMSELLGATMPLCGLKEPADWPNSCNLNLYEDGGMSVGWHADDERLFQGKFLDCRIISLSLGATRRFELRLNWPEEGERPLRQVLLSDGDLLTMEGMTQKHFQHRVPREENVHGPRINLTWRWVTRHGPRCPVERRRGR